MAQEKSSKPLVLNNLLIQNVNTWGNVQYNIPLRLSNNETRTATSIAHRHIPHIPHNFDCRIHDPLPERVTGRDMVVEKESYKTTTGEYCVKPNPNKAMERSDCASNCKKVIYMTGVEKKLQGVNIIQPIMVSEMKDQYKGVTRSPLSPPEIIVKPPDPEYIFDVVAAGRNEAPVIPENASGFNRLLDPYVSTYRAFQKPFTTDEQYGIGAKDHITFYTESNIPKVK
ncbi:unnamed protein product [Parnassius apollo]|uniref:(apollo) hypothetical protein n=1 Tax=Parnassius apollo TaxID=110799 RepID=A0A8S3X3B2_PARAO|nr:unnamed protein product [Parnassius apollo]